MSRGNGSLGLAACVRPRWTETTTRADGQPVVAFSNRGHSSTTPTKQEGSWGKHG